MPSISDIVSAFNKQLDQTDSAITAMKAEIADLKQQLADSKAAASEITPDDQKLIDGVNGRIKDINSRLSDTVALANTGAVVAAEPQK